MSEKFRKQMGDVAKIMSSQKLMRFDNGARCESTGWQLDLTFPLTTLNLREVVGYIRSGDGSIVLDELEMDPVAIDREHLAILAGLADSTARNDAHLFLDGKDALFVSGVLPYSYSFPMRVPLIKQMSKGHRIMLDGPVAFAFAGLAKASIIADVPLRMAVGTNDGGETMFLDMEMGHAGDEEHFHARLEQPVVFAPWIDFTKAMSQFMGDMAVVAQVPLRSLRAALNKSEEIAHQERGDKPGLFSEMMFEDGRMAIRPIPKNGHSGYHDKKEPIPVKVDGVSSDLTITQRYFTTRVLKEALGIFKGDAASLSVSAKEGSPILLWADDVYFAVRTAHKGEEVSDE